MFIALALAFLLRLRLFKPTAGMEIQHAES
jgi:hypothetical protein